MARATLGGPRDPGDLSLGTRGAGPSPFRPSARPKPALISLRESRRILRNRSNCNPVAARTRSSSNRVSRIPRSPRTVFLKNREQVRTNAPDACAHGFPPVTCVPLSPLAPDNRLLNPSIPSCRSAISSVIRAVFSFQMPPIMLPLVGTNLTPRRSEFLASLPLMFCQSTFALGPTAMSLAKSNACGRIETHQRASSLPRSRRVWSST